MAAASTPAARDHDEDDRPSERGDGAAARRVAHSSRRRRGAQAPRSSPAVWRGVVARAGGRTREHGHARCPAPAWARPRQQRRHIACAGMSDVGGVSAVYVCGGAIAARPPQAGGFACGRGFGASVSQPGARVRHDGRKPAPRPVSGSAGGGGHPPLRPGRPSRGRAAPRHERMAAMPGGVGQQAGCDGGGLRRVVGSRLRRSRRVARP